MVQAVQVVAVQVLKETQLQQQLELLTQAVVVVVVHEVEHLSTMEPQVVLA
jgi:hypothetical protein